MKAIGIVQAKANLSKIAEQVKRSGKPVTLTKNGHPYVDLVPHQRVKANSRSQSAVLDDLDQFRSELPKSNAEQIRADMVQGRH